MHKELKINTNVPANHSNSSNRAFIKPSYVCTECGSPMKHIYTHQYSNVYLSDCVSWLFFSPVLLWYPVSFKDDHNLTDSF